MLYGWVGKILRLDLTNGRIATEDTMEYVPKFIWRAGFKRKDLLGSRVSEGTCL